MKKNISYITSTLCGLCLLCVFCASCEDYTEHNFGKPEDLYQATQVNSYNLELTAANYQDIAKNAENLALAAEDETGETQKQLQMVAENGCFLGNITPAEYLPAILKNLVGASQYYSMTQGSTITIKYKSGELVSGDAYMPQTGELTSSGKYLLVPKGEAQALATSGEGKTYGYLQIAGSTSCPNTVTRVDDNAIVANEVADGYLYSLEKAGDEWYILNPYEEYLYMKGTFDSFNYIDDTGDLEDEEWPTWTIAYDAENEAYTIKNTGNEKVMWFDTAYKSAGAYAEPKETYVPIQLYKRVQDAVEVVLVSDEEQEIVFTLDEDGWGANGDYLNCELTGGNTLTDMDAVYDATGWSVEYKGSIGELTYVWRYDATYGLRGSAFKSSTYYPTDAWAISPAMNLKKAEHPVLVFEQAQKYAGTPVTDYLQVWVSTNYTGRGGLEAATWTNMTDKVEGTWPDGSDWTYLPMSLDLTEYAGQKTVNVAFRYISTDAVAATWEVKNVVCREAEE